MARWFSLSRIREIIGGVLSPKPERPQEPSEPTYFGTQPRTYWSSSRLDDIYGNVDPKRWDYSDEMSTREEEKGRRLFYRGWVARDISKEAREEAREEFKDFMVEWDVPADFPWDDWREWYDEGAA
jgi:hypothetical protein